MPSNTGANSALANWPIGRKLLLVLGLMAVPVVILAGFLMRGQNDKIKQTQSEISGVELVTATRGLLECIPQHRNSVNAAVNGDTTERGRAEQLQSAIDRSFAAVESVSSKYPDLGFSDRVSQAKRSWQDLKGRGFTRETVDAENRLMSDVVDLMRQVGEKSGLINDT